MVALVGMGWSSAGTVYCLVTLVDGRDITEGSGLHTHEANGRHAVPVFLLVLLHCSAGKCHCTFITRCCPGVCWRFLQGTRVRTVTCNIMHNLYCTFYICHCAASIMNGKPSPPPGWPPALSACALGFAMLIAMRAYLSLRHYAVSVGIVYMHVILWTGQSCQVGFRNQGDWDERHQSGCGSPGSFGGRVLTTGSHAAWALLCSCGCGLHGALSLWACLWLAVWTTKAHSRYTPYSKCVAWAPGGTARMGVTHNS